MVISQICRAVDKETTITAGKIKRMWLMFDTYGIDVHLNICHGMYTKHLLLLSLVL